MSLGHKVIGKKGKAIEGVSIRALVLWCFMFRERDSIFCISAFRVAALTICWYSWNKKGMSVELSLPRLISLSLTPPTPQQPLNRHTCLCSLSSPFFREQLWSYWASSRKNLWETIHILLHRPTKKSSALRLIKLSLVFNYHFLIPFAFVTYNTSLDKPPLWIS